MKKTNAPLDTLKKIILIYANTPPYPVENLRVIEKELTDPCFYMHPEVEGAGYLWEGGITSYGIINMRIAMIIGIHNLGLIKAKEILSDVNQKDEFISSVLGYEESYPPDIKRRRKLYNSSFYEIFGFSISSYCPCSLTKMDVLSEEGFVTSDEDLKKAVWIKERLNCLQCNHIHFASILKNLSKGKYRHMGEIVKGYSKVSTEDVAFWNEKQPIAKFTYASVYEENKAAFQKYLDGLPCNILVDLLSSDPSYAKKIRSCPECKFFFFSKTKRSSTFCSDQCRLAFHNRKRRESGEHAKYKREKRKEGRYQ